MNNGYDQNRNGRSMPSGGNQPPRQRQPQGQSRSGRVPPRDPEMIRRGQAPRQGQPRPPQDPYARSGRAVPNPEQGRQGRSDGQRPRGTRALNDTHRKATREQMREDNRRRRKDARRTFLGRLALYGVLFLVVGAIVFGVFTCVFYSTPDSNESTVNFVEKYDGKTGVSTKVSGELAYRNGNLYVNFSNIAEGCSMSIISDAASAKFVLLDGGDTSDSAGTGHEEYAAFIKNSREVIVCGQDFRLSDIAIFSDGNVWVPADFVTDYMNGITLTEDKAGGNVYITRDRDEAESGDEDAPLAEVSFRLKAITAPDPTEVPEGTETTGGMPELEFATDLSDYEQYMNPENAKEYLVLVNKTTTVDKDFIPDGLTDVTDTRKDGRATQRMREAAAKALEAMFIELRAAGYTDVSVTSAYRSYEYQDQLYTMYTGNEMAENPSLTKEQAQAIVDTYSAKPGTSEHQTGLCCDLHNLPGADKSFANEPAYDWLSQNAWKFGFILRFPKDKTDITGYDFEPWHYRFVGRNAAWKIHSEDLCLEEYLAN